MDLSKIEEIIQTAKDSQVSELTIRSEAGSVTVKKGAAPAVVVRAAAKAKPVDKAPKREAAAAEPADVAVTAPMVGIFHSTDTSLGIGSAIKAGQTVGAIESMKLMNEVVAQSGGTVLEIDVEDGAPVEYGQLLLRLAPEEAK